MTEEIEPTPPAAGFQPRSDGASRALTSPDVVKRTTGPVTTDGSRWEVQLSMAPTPAWLEFFKRAAGPSPVPAFSPARVTFDRSSIVFKSDEDHVEQWIAAIDTWIAWAGAHHAMSLDEASRQRSLRLDEEAKQRERVQRLNDRFRNL